MTNVNIEDDRPPADEMSLGPERQVTEVEPEPVEIPLVEVGEIADGIRLAGEGLHAFVGHPEVPEHWAFTEIEIARLAPPVTALINRHAVARRLAQRSPELAVTLVMGRWGLRNTRLTAAIRAAEAELAEAETAEVEPSAEGVRVDLSPLDDDG